MTQRRSLMCALAVILAVVQGDAQQSTPQRASGTIGETVTAVVVDVVVRDRRGQPVRDLTQADFQVLEDGVPQNIGSFSGVFSGAPAAAPAAAFAQPAPSAPAAAKAAAPVVADTSVPVTALVFDLMNPEARRIAV